MSSAPLAALLFGSLFALAAADPPCFSQIQTISTHNSYHLPPPTSLLNFLNSALVKALLPPSAFLPQSWEYSQPSLGEQLTSGVRSFELDVRPDPDGGLYAAPAGLKLAGVDPQLADPAWRQPGWKVLHIPDIDFETTCVTLVNCLTAVRDWSVANPGHLPITMFLETGFGETEVQKQLGASNVQLVETQLAINPVGPTKLVTYPEFSEYLLAALDSEIASVFFADELITPDFVRTAKGLPPSASLADALRQPPASGAGCPWPAIDALRGKIMLAIIPSGEPVVSAYSAMHPNQEGALAWLVYDSFPVEDAVFASVGNFDLSLQGGAVPPEIPANAGEIVGEMAAEVGDKVGQGYLVRARADADTVEARSGYTARAEAVLSSGAQYVVTDFPVPSKLFSSQYAVVLPGGLSARCVLGVSGLEGGPDISCGQETSSSSPPPPSSPAPILTNSTAAPSPVPSPSPGSRSSSPAASLLPPPSPAVPSAAVRNAGTVSTAMAAVGAIVLCRAVSV